MGRDTDLATLTQALAQVGVSVVTQAVYGLGGVGKSELALQYAARRSRRYRLVWWVSADDGEVLQESLADLARRLEPAHALLGTTTVDAAGWAVQWLQCHSGWLLILDNVEDSATVTAFLGQVGRYGHVVITTRRDINWRGAAKPLPLDVLTSGAAVDLLAKLVGSAAETGALAELAAELGCLPLALEQAGAYIAEQRITVAKYLTLLRQKPAEAFAGVDEGGQATRTVARVWDVTLEAITSRDPMAGFLLQVMAYFAPDNIPRDFLTSDAPDIDAVDKALGILASYSMITLDEQTISLHRLVQAVLREQAKHQHTQHDHGETPAAVATGMLTAAMPDGHLQTDIGIWPAWRELAPHIDALAQAIPDDQATEEIASLLGQSAFFAWTQGQHNVALPKDQRALAISEAMLGPDHPTVGLRLDNLASTLNDLGRTGEALPLQQRALAITEAALDPDHPDVATRLNNLAQTLKDLGRTGEALPLQQRALAITEAALGPDNPDVGLRLNNLAYTLNDLGRTGEALSLQQRALAITEAALGPDNPTVGLRLNNLAYTLNDLGRTGEALSLQQRALAITEAALGPDHPTVAVMRRNLGGDEPS